MAKLNISNEIIDEAIETVNGQGKNSSPEILSIAFEVIEDLNDYRNWEKHIKNPKFKENLGFLLTCLFILIEQEGLDVNEVIRANTIKFLTADIPA